MPVAMARWLLEKGLPPTRTVWVLERLTLPDERVQRLTLVELAAAEEAFSDLSVVVFRRMSGTVRAGAIWKDTETTTDR